MNDPLLTIGSWIFAIVFMVLWFWKGMNAAMWFYLATAAVVAAIVFMGGPQFISGVVTGIVANEITRRLTKK